MTFELSEAACEVLERALAEVRRANGEGYGDAEALEVVARVALAAQGAPLGQPDHVRSNEATTASTPAATTASTPAATTASTATATTASTAAAPKASTAGSTAGGAAASTAGAAGAAGSTAGGAAASMKAAGLAGAAPVRAWSWDDLGWGATQGGSSSARNPSCADGATSKLPGAEGAWWADGEADESEGDSGVDRDEWGEINSRLLQAMGGRGRWNADRLIDATGLSAREVNTALTFLELGGRIRRRQDAFEPI